MIPQSQCKNYTNVTFYPFSYLRETNAEKKTFFGHCSKDPLRNLGNLFTFWHQINLDRGQVGNFQKKVRFFRWLPL